MGGSVLLFVERENGNVWFLSRSSRASNPLLSLCGHSQPVGDSEHVFVYLVYKFPRLVVPFGSLLGVIGNTIVVVLPGVPSQLIGQFVASPVVSGYPTIVLVLLCLMSCDPFRMYCFRTLGCDDLIPENTQVPVKTSDPVAWLASSVLNPSKSFDYRLIVDGKLDASRAYVATMAAVSSIYVELSLVLFVPIFV